MEAPKENGLEKSRLSTRTILRIAAIAIAALLLIGFCISISLYNNMQGRYTNARNELGDAVYQNLYMMRHKGDELSLAGADVQGSVLPTMKEYFVIARAMDDALHEIYGNRYTVMRADQLNALQAAYDAYDAAFKGGRDTTAARDQLLAALGQVDQLLTERFDAQGRLLPAE